MLRPLSLSFWIFMGLLGKLKMCVMVIWILLGFLPQEITTVIIFYCMYVLVGLSYTSFCVNMFFSKCFIWWNCMLVYQVFYKSIDSGAGWGSEPTKTKTTTKKTQTQNKYQILWECFVTPSRMEEPYIVS